MANEVAGEQGGFYDPATDEKGYMLDYPRVHVTGKVTTDTPLLTTSQDVAGAINELFTLDPGGGDKWTYPADWIQMPSPASNEVYCVGTISLGTSKYGAVVFENYITGSVGTIDWGDGVTTVITSGTVGHIYVDGTGHLVDSGMEQFLIKVTMENPSLFGGVTFAPVYTGRPIVASPFVLALAYGAETVYPEQYVSSSSVHQIQLPNITICPSIADAYALKKITTPTKLVTLSGLQNCFSVEEIDLSEATSVNIYWCHSIKKLDLPKCTTAQIAGCYVLREINAPLLTNAALNDNFSLTKVTHADGATLNIGNCPVLYPKT
jgi:hypothetical protein